MSYQSPIPNPQSPIPASAIILTGGKSSRMGRPKALLPFDNEPLVTHLVRTLQSCFTDIVVVAAPDQDLPPLPVTLTRDAVAYQGPVGGMVYGLQAAHGELCFITSCDAPFLNLAFIAHLLSLADAYDVVVPHWQERLQPLHAVYRRSVLPLLQEQLERNELRPIFLYKKVRTREVSEEELRRFDPSGLSFRNMNSPEDYQEALALWQTRKQSMACTIELFGVARLRAKTDAITLHLPPGVTLTDALAALAAHSPMLVGVVISPEDHTLLPGYTCNLNGAEFLRDYHAAIRDGDHLLILSSDAGG